MTISIIMPVHNTGEYLVECLESIWGQTFTDYELICVDDASDDQRTIELLGEYEKADNRMKVIRLQEHVGAANARNIGFKECFGRFVLFLDADDIFSPVFLEQMYLEISKEQADVCICGYTEFFLNIEGQYQNGNCALLSKKKLMNRSREEWLVDVTTVPWNKICRRDYLNSNQIYFQDLTSCNDVFWSCMVMECAEKIGVIEDANLIRHRTKTSTQISANRDSVNLYYAIRLLIEQNKENTLFMRQCKALLLVAMISELARCPIETKNEQLYENIKQLFVGESITFHSKLIEKCKENVISLPYSSYWFKNADRLEWKLALLKNEIKEVLRNSESVFLWGMGKRGEEFQKFCKNEGVDLGGVTDVKNEKVGLVTAYGYLVMHTEDVIAKREGVVIACNSEIYEFLLLKKCKLHIINLEEYVTYSPK